MHNDGDKAPLIPWSRAELRRPGRRFESRRLHRCCKLHCIAKIRGTYYTWTVDLIYICIPPSTLLDHIKQVFFQPIVFLHFTLQRATLFTPFILTFKMKSTLIGLAAAAGSAYAATQSAYGQCGGQGWTGATTCVSGYHCVSQNPYYSQCVAGSGQYIVLCNTESH